MSSRIIGLGLVLGMACVQCGAREMEFGDSGGGGAEPNGAAPDAGCDDAAAGAKPLEPYARLHSACSLDVTVNRRGADGGIDSVPISEHIKPSP